MYIFTADAHGARDANVALRSARRGGVQEAPGITVTSTHE